MRNVLIRLSLIVVMLLVAPFAMADTDQQPILIGAIYNTTGSQSPLDAPSAMGAQLAIKEINKSGGLLGKPVKLLLVDGQSQPNVIMQEAKNFAKNPNVSVVIGLSDTNMVLAAAPPLAEVRKLFITSGATSPNLPQQIPNYLFLTCYTDLMQANTMASYAYNQLQGKTAYIFADQDMSYSILLAQYFQQAFKNAGGNVTNISTFKSNANIAGLLNKLKANKGTPDVIYLAAGPSEAATLIKQIRQAGYKQPILGGDSFDSSDLLKQLNKQTDNIYFTTHALISYQNPAYNVRQFIRKYRAAYHQMPANSFAALGYDTVKLLASAITQAQSTDPVKIKQALFSLTDWKGVTGPISYVNNTPIPNKPVTIIKIHRDRQVLVKQDQ